jgi:hypothetical protein
MPWRKCLPLMLVTAAIAGPWMGGSSEQAEARPQYRAEYRKLFPQQGRPKCFVCHLPRDSEPEKPDLKRRNPYGVRVEEALGEKNVKDREQIRKALREVGPLPTDDGRY